MLTIRPVTPTHVPLQPLFIPCTWHTKSLLLYPTSCILPCSYLYIALLVTTLFSTLHPACTNSVTLHWIPYLLVLLLPDRSRAAVLRPHCYGCIAGSQTAAGCEAGRRYWYCLPIR